MAGGKLVGTLEISGDQKEAVRSASGHFLLTGARYALPADLQLLGRRRSR